MWIAGGLLASIACHDVGPATSPEGTAGARTSEQRIAPAPEDMSVRPDAAPSADSQPAVVTEEDGALRPAEMAPPAPPFPPAHFEPPFPRSAQPGDGVWQPLGEGGGERPWMVRTTVRPHEVSRFHSLHVVALDLSRLVLHYMPGADDMGNERLPAPYQPGLVPEDHRTDVLVAFNGGFMPQHGRWGMKAAGVVIVPPRQTGCTIGLFPGEEAGKRVRIAPWPALAGDDAHMPFYRQTPPCLLEGGSLHPELERGNEKLWGGFNKNLVTRRRSAIGLDADGHTLFYAVGIEVGPRLLAEGLRYAGATAAAELDINDNWTRFALFAMDESVGEPRVATMLLKDMVKQKSGYVARPSARDFFYVRPRQ